MTNTTLKAEIQIVLDEQWQRLAHAGTWFTGAQRVAIAQVARQARLGEPLPATCLNEITTAAATKIAVQAHSIDEAWVNHCFAGGLTPLELVELTAIVAQFTCMDTYTVGIGDGLLDLPEPVAGEPSKREVKGAKLMRGWYPTRGIAGAPNCFSAVAAEHQALHNLHAALYLSMEEMADVSVIKDLHRSQIELLAARTSHYNDCFY